MPSNKFQEILNHGTKYRSCVTDKESILKEKGRRAEAEAENVDGKGSRRMKICAQPPKLTLIKHDQKVDAGQARYPGLGVTKGSLLLGKKATFPLRSSSLSAYVQPELRRFYYIFMPKLKNSGN